MDSDHLVAIDGLTRRNACARPMLARLSGVLFSCGHGAVVIVVACCVSVFATHWQAPRWLDAGGTMVSVAFLFLLGTLNLRALVVASPQENVLPIGLRARLFESIALLGAPGAILMGVCFAISFDTLSQAALFAAVARRVGGTFETLVIAGIFAVGMTMVDGANGLWIARMLRRADGWARFASRTVTLTIIVLSFGLGALMLCTLVLPALDAWTDRHGLLMSATVIAAIVFAFLVATGAREGLSS